MSVGFVMLVHEALDRAAQVARHLHEAGKPVVIHADLRVADSEMSWLTRKLADCERVVFSQRKRCDWGSWSIVEATQAAGQMMLDRFPDTGHIYLASGSCLPLRPISELQTYLDARPDTDFIESVTIDEVDWTMGGLDQERFTLRFPFSWKRQRRLFDAYVDIQRRLGLKRKIPSDIEPHLGSQWWCLSRRTLQAILSSPERDVHERYFKQVWIPDESYFQTLARLYSTSIESRSLTLSKFDFQGKPHVFYDDHLQLLRRSDCFVARKIWPDAARLYEAFLALRQETDTQVEPNPLKIDKLFSRATERRMRGRTGLLMQGRYPRTENTIKPTASRYSVFQGFDVLFEGFEDWLSRRTGNRVHGHLFSKSRVEFAGGVELFNGCLSDNASLRDYNPQAFLTNLIWNTRGEHQCFMFGPSDAQEIMPFMSADQNAQISIISGAWAIPLFLSDSPFESLRKEAAHLQRIEAQQLTALRRSPIKARVNMWSLAEFIEDPMERLQMLLDELGGGAQRRLTEVPKMADLADFGSFLQKLKNQGMSPYLMGDFPMFDGAAQTPPRDDQRPYLVK